MWSAFHGMLFIICLGKSIISLLWTIWMLPTLQLNNLCCIPCKWTIGRPHNNKINIAVEIQTSTPRHLHHPHSAGQSTGNFLTQWGHSPYRCTACLNTNSNISWYRVVFSDQDNMFKYVWKGYKIHPQTKIRVCFTKLPIEKGYFVKWTKLYSKHYDSLCWLVHILSEY